ncbi:magnesium transporter [Marinibacterium profundimaris]|uniref:Magnesium transporter MgtE n=1 Tax=Marinibacterium profundimaris TaxID=1679460 RepID=A0A225NG42_9RHOB|nr:magnesium transporter [Marinibacterium profundimaris]OWU72535.1 magnesium transporter [Marinibacterium profundimaris]
MSEETETPDVVEEREEQAYALDRKTWAGILYALDVEDPELLESLTAPMHAADIADLLEQFNPYDRGRFIRLYSGDIHGDILSELDESLREEVIRFLDPDQLAEAVRTLESDDVVDLVEDMDDADAEAILGALEDSDRVAVQQALSFPEGSAGRLMQREVVWAPDHWTVGEAIDYMRNTEDLPDQFYHIVLVDPRMRPMANVTLGRLMASRREVKLADLAEESFRVIPVTQDEEDVAYAFNQYHLISAPVVDDDGRLIGVITIDDAMIVLDEEHEEDILLLAGVTESSLSEGVIETSKSRLPWLFINMCTAVLSSIVIAQFEDTIEAFVALAVLLPIVASMGGNAGTQTLTVSVRALATRDLTAANLMRVVRREATVGLMNGVAFAVCLGIVGMVWFGMPQLGLVIAAALIVNMLVAALAGTLVPVTLDRLGVDPALASGTFVTTMTDMMGFFAFLGLATVILL